MPPTQARRSSGSSRNASTPASSVIRSATPSRTPVVAMTSGHNSAIAIRGRGHKVRNGVIGAVILLIAALVLAVFGAWGWVGGKLNKADWLTTAADTPASTWLILGSDERDGSTNFGGVDDISGYRTDTILVLTKPKSGPSSLISIPRDSLMNVDDQYMKINAVAQLVGKKALVGEIEQLTGQKIDHVAQVKFGGLQKVVDALGGVELCYDQDVQDAYSGLNWTAGCHNADGSTALSFSRMRYADATGDFGRNARQRQVISAIVKKASSKETLTNPKTVTTMAEAGLSALTVDGKTTPLTLVNMALAFKDATGSKGISGSVYWSNPDYYMDGVGSSVLLDDAKNTELFSQLAAGTHAAGTVGTLAES
ncbi:LCP family protein [Bifidobacterium breve]|uniref:LCP family protein n=1 Tax=Bifidobacterium breve TaxID=1685 RepID=UPI0023313808|nr:LCP family protein [Bifidobacterium breve]MDB1176505.1 LCP family protein [Bifidobacterium breve]MDB1184276.1 LCP family protein [Bifidobacterium breve]